MTTAQIAGGISPAAFLALSPEERDVVVTTTPGFKEFAASPIVQNYVAACRGATATPYTPRQQEADDLLETRATHCMLFGGSRSSKTFIICRKMVKRRLLAPESRGAILRFRFNHLKASIIFDTMPKVLKLCYPGVKVKLDKVDWRLIFENGSEIWFGGLDDKERTEKILGQEYSDLFLNECSQIPLSSRKLAVTRLAQKVPGLPLKMYYDCNPPSKRHWSYLYFIDKIEPERSQPLANPDNYAAMQLNPIDNLPNLAPGYIEELKALPEAQRRRFLEGIFSDDSDTALWTLAMLDNGRIVHGEYPDLKRVIIAVDPSGCSGPEDLRSDEVGIVVVGLGDDGRAYVLEDLSGRYGPEKWKTLVASAYDRWSADCVVAETNYGGAMVGEVIRTASAKDGMPIHFREVTASRGKIVRAEPVAALFAQGRVSLVGRFRELEHQLLAMTTAGYMGDKSPDRADAMIWGVVALFQAITRQARRERPPPQVHLAYAHAKKHLRPRRR